MLRQSHLFQDAVEQLATQQTETIVAHCAAQPSLSMNSLSGNKPGHSSLNWYTLFNRKRERSQEMKLLETTIVFFFLESQIQTEPTAQSVVLVSVAASWFSCTYIPEINILVGSTKSKEGWLSCINIDAIDLFGSQCKTLFTFLSAIELNWK